MKRMARNLEGSTGRSISAQVSCGGGYLWHFLLPSRCRSNFIFHYVFPHKNFVLVIHLKIKMFLYIRAMKPHGELEV
jgi:hypothetical protein